MIVEELRRSADEIERALVACVRAENFLDDETVGEGWGCEVEWSRDQSKRVNVNNESNVVRSASVGRLLTVPEVADVMGSCTMTVYRAIWRGELVAARIGRSVRVSVEDLRTFLAARRAVGVP